MINPSANGWIDKFLNVQKTFLPSTLDNDLSFYLKIRKTGFIYGHIATLPHFPIHEFNEWKMEEKSKVALLSNLFAIYCYTTKDNTSQDFIKKTLSFYKEIAPEGFGLLSKIIPSSSSSKLEDLIDDRIQTNKDIISKNFSNIVTNALLFVDILAFHQFLKEGKIPEKYLKRIEETIMNIISLALKIKTKKSPHDDLLVKLFEASVRYSKFSKGNHLTFDALPLDFITTDLEKYYLIDLAGITLWTDGQIEKEEIYFLHKLAEKIEISSDFVIESSYETNQFISTNKKNIPYFNTSNPVKHFYDHTTTGVQVLIQRNKKRLIKELSESKELMQLLAQSSKRDLAPDEKKKVKKQLLDICKSIPSLTIFLLPGGALLLPILIKFIPQLLPSSFNENLED